MMRGLMAFSCSYANPMAAMVPGRKFSSTTSDLRTRSVKICLPSGERMSRQMLFLPRL